MQLRPPSSTVTAQAFRAAGAQDQRAPVQSLRLVARPERRHSCRRLGGRTASRTPFLHQTRRQECRRSLKRPDEPADQCDGIPPRHSANSHVIIRGVKITRLLSIPPVPLRHREVGTTHDSTLPAGLPGSRITKLAPPAAPPSTDAEPPWAATTARTTLRPRPRPASERLLSPR